ncbi:MAG TPA: DUF6048 family protein [Flavobacteriaceae bacterium]|nr:DUF6048 family protein [Flavobacteriaceae bacterium]
MQHIIKYSIKNLAFIFLFCASVSAQNDSIVSTITDSVKVQNDSIKIKNKFGLRVGGDISKLVRSFIDDDYKGFEINGDFRLTRKMYLAAELGTEEKISSTDYLNVTTTGSYIKAGIDYNLYKNWLDMENMIYSGFRIGASTFNHTLNDYTIYSQDQYWTPQFTSDTAEDFDGLTAIWAEIIFGIKAEVFNNLYVGLNVQFKGLVSETEPSNFENLYIPGFNKTYDSGGFGFGIGYNISYLIPLYKKDKALAIEE